jgi:hypothetical protein
MVLFCPTCNLPFTEDEVPQGKCLYCQGILVASKTSLRHNREDPPSPVSADVLQDKAAPARKSRNLLEPVKAYLHQWVEKVIVSRLPRSPALAYFLVALGWALYFPAVVAALVSGVGVVLLLRAREWEPALWVALVLVAASCCAAASVWCRSLGWRILAGRADAGFNRDARPHTLYLRPFQFDRSWAPQDPFRMPRTYEEHFARVLGKFGPFVAIGRPGEPLPELGAGRVYVEDDVWQQRVQELMENAAVVLLTVGDSGGLQWELEQAVALAGPERLLLFVPFGSSPDQRAQASARQSAYDAFRLWAQNVLPRGLPAQIGDSCFIYFAKDWTPLLLPPPEVTFLLGIKRVRVEVANQVLQPLLESLQQDRLFLRPMHVKPLVLGAVLGAVLILIILIVVFDFPVFLGIPLLLVLPLAIAFGLMAAQRKL